MSFNTKNSGARRLALQGEFGIEKECMRITPEGFMSHARHPFGRSKYFQRDFCENQTELVTDVFKSPGQVCRRLYDLHSLAYYTMDKSETRGELLWPFSNPPYVRGEEDVPVADFHGRQKGKTLYRRYLGEKYGKMQMLYSGIHLNYSFSEEFLRLAFEESGQADFTAFKNSAYLELAKKLTDCAWLIVYLTAASPVADGSLFDKNRLGETLVTEYSSLRCSEKGYWNSFTPVLDYESLASYIDSVRKYIGAGKLQSISELYYPVRLKPRGANSLENLEKNGVNHIELRMIDVNPFSPTGVIIEDIEFVSLLAAFLMSREDISFEEEKQLNAVKNEKTAALLDCGAKNLAGTGDTLKCRALKILDCMTDFYSALNDENILNILRIQRKKITDPQKSYAQRVIAEFGKDYVHSGVRLAKKYREELTGLSDKI